MRGRGCKLPKRLPRSKQVKILSLVCSSKAGRRKWCSIFTRMVRTYLWRSRSWTKSSKSSKSTSFAWSTRATVYTNKRASEATAACSKGRSRYSKTLRLSTDSSAKAATYKTRTSLSAAGPSGLGQLAIWQVSSTLRAYCSSARYAQSRTWQGWGTVES